ncbi:peptidoglycan DD-metalloendopeptidase family protein [Algoriphagus halophytocola]|uniref:Peptidoglycan DD-metalloendopeptidase family protein n=1 Tax=Algoriphagus halophytocola TaxID=2991499 RepID=A0ABY6MFS9_9BACT|nr:MULTISPECIES: peptidoglycan DD-metalloendopeptidase family protein [unclassified Algoriphagus]UZD21292.1 peptidoglycan DD-metalloendopeptidase family protein [Algoriphagus sp. TR-M5]WBL42503.1 peptidoglycan DD-metalloendopeptidase family protein [Algoriphagus sp. TR-M9]
MNWNAHEFFPIVGKPLTSENTLKLDFSSTNTDLKSIDLRSTQAFDEYVFGQILSEGKTFGIGGYLENRAIYARSEVFATKESEYRNIHLGIDIWAKAGTEIHAPLDGEIHSFQDNAGFGNYGATIILQHEVGGRKLFSLYGHLFRQDLIGLQPGQKVQAGEVFCGIGPFPENGDWPPHLHFQLMWDLLGNSGDFPGVCSQPELQTYMEICPDPNLMLKCELL